MDQVSGEPTKKKMGLPAKIGLGLVGFFVLLAVFGGNEEAKRAAEVEPLAKNSTAADAVAAAEPDDGLSGPQRNARREAENYLEMKGFSRAGLIEQLSSEYGSSYAMADATAAVDSLAVDWNEQARRAGESYLEMKGFSCDALQEQLSSSYGDDFTREQAAFGARAAGAC